MANRYLIGSGAFTSTSIWSTTYNGSGGASVPVSGDIIHVDANHNITSGLPSDSSFDFIVYLGANSSNSVTLGLSDSPTFRSLIIQSKNSAAHTVNFDDNATITTDKFIGIGSSSSNKLYIGNPSIYKSDHGFMTINDTSYGQYLDMDMWLTAGFPKAYIGSNSIVSIGGGQGGLWLTQDPPKISTLVDPLTTAPGSNTNWTTYVSSGDGGSITQVTTGYSGGGYKLTGGQA